MLTYDNVRLDNHFPKHEIYKYGTYILYKRFGITKSKVGPLAQYILNISNILCQWHMQMAINDDIHCSYALIVADICICHQVQISPKTD